MAGQTLRVIPRQTLDFSYLGDSDVETRVLVGKISTAGWSEGSLLVRVHNKSITSGTLKVQVFADASTPADPANTFIAPDVITDGEVEIDSTSTLDPGDFVVQAIAGDLGSMVAIAVEATQGPEDGDPFAANISVDLILKAS